VLQYSSRHTIESRKHQAVHIAERQSLRGFAPQHVESKDKVSGFQRSPRPEQSDQGAPDQPAKIAALFKLTLSLPQTQTADREGTLVLVRSKSVKEIAEIIGIAEATVKTRMFYARKKLAALVATA
jgi:DNA-directed RNA polymerase specialized sigma24 family protein